MAAAAVVVVVVAMGVVLEHSKPNRHSLSLSDEPMAMQADRAAMLSPAAPTAAAVIAYKVSHLRRGAERRRRVKIFFFFSLIAAISVTLFFLFIFLIKSQQRPAIATATRKPIKSLSQSHAGVRGAC